MMKIILAFAICFLSTIGLAQEEKQVIAVQALFEEEPTLDSIWQLAMSYEGVQCARSYGARPHMTMASFQLNKEEIIQLSDSFTRLNKTYPAHQFETHISPVRKDNTINYYLSPPEGDTPLLDIHHALYTTLDKGYERFRKVDVPGNWWPHITMFTIPADDQLANLLEAAMKQVERVTIKGFALVGFGPIQYFEEIKTIP